ncbi:MAG: PKD domain-containing protein [Nitrospinae bacterium]|nr:PKD domain-containing protein [Nitrospinota bacterium]
MDQKNISGSKPEKTKETITVCTQSAAYKLIVDNGYYTYTEIEEDEKDDAKGKDDDKGNKKHNHKNKHKHTHKHKHKHTKTKTMVSAGEVKINGKEIIDEHDFKKKLARVERIITLPHGENLMVVEVKGKPGAFITVSIECVSGCLEPKVTFPVTGAVINKSKTIVQGNLSNLYREAGVIIQSSGVNGQVSGLTQTQGTGFAGIIPLQQGQNTITATATYACGYKATDTITVQTNTLQETIKLTASPSSGILDTTGILTVTFEAETSIPNPVSNYSWDLNGDGTAEFTGMDSKVQGEYESPGLYFPKLTITDNQGNTYTETTIVNVLSRDEMDALLKGKWDGMKGGLSQGSVGKALVYIASGSQNIYRYNFELMSSILPTITQDMGNITLVNIEDDVAEYEMIATQDGKTLSFYVEFVKDVDGIWRIRFY